MNGLIKIATISLYWLLVALTSYTIGHNIASYKYQYYYDLGVKDGIKNQLDKDQYLYEMLEDKNE